ncbi:MAG: hypothetical protein ACE5PT_14175 [Gemmatimonadales bacterium]
MGQINLGRVLLGGLVAGVVINVGEFLLNGVILADAMEAMYETMGIEEPGGGAMVVWVILGFVMGIALVWLYAAIRPRFGPGPRTAAVAGACAWVFAYLVPMVGFTAMGVWALDASLIIALVWGLVEFVLAGMAGGWPYREGAA